MAMYLITAIAWLFLAGSMFLPRANDYFYDVEANLLHQYEPVGTILIVALLLLIPLTVLALRGAWVAGLAVTLLWLLAFGLTVLAAFNLGTHGTDYSASVGNSPAEGTVLSLIASAAGLGAAFFAAPDKPTSRSKSPSGKTSARP
jgi:hypothetical protein